MNQTDKLDIHSIGILFLNGLLKLRDQQDFGSHNARILGIVAYKLKQQGALPPMNTVYEEALPLDKDQLLTLTGLLQMHSTDHRYNNTKREEYRQIAKLLRNYLYDNYQLSPNIIPKQRRPPKPTEAVHNPPTP